jgi:hypothetical protein
MTKSILAVAIVALLAGVGSDIAHAEDKEKVADDKDLVGDLKLLQGSWELLHLNKQGTPTMRSVKTIEGNKETLRRINLQTGDVKEEWTVEFKLSKSGGVRVFTFYPIGESPKTGYSYIYKVDEKNFYDVPGLLNGDEYKNYQNVPRVIVWKRKKTITPTAPAIQSDEKTKN